MRRILLYLPQRTSRMQYIYQHPNWPMFFWDNDKLLTKLGQVRYLQGRLIGKISSLGFPFKAEATLTTLTLDVTKSAEIEGEKLDYEQVRSSFARKLGIETTGLVASARSIDGIVEMMLDATQNYLQPLTSSRLFGWHSVLFPNGRSGLYKITAGNWRQDKNGPMQVVSGGIGKEIVHYQAPEAAQVPTEMGTFLKWLNQKSQIDSIIKSAIAHFWFVTIHPFDDGNGRIARAITDMLLARSDETPQRFYSFSAQIMKDRNAYYKVLELSQRGPLDLTLWLEWFLDCLEKAIKNSEIILQKTLQKAEFWKVHSGTLFNVRQQLMINKLLDGFEGKLKTSKWAKITKCSADTALRDIKDLIEKGILKQDDSGGRSTNYELIEP